MGAAPITFGRSPDAAIVLQTQFASRRHAEVRIEQAGVVVHDLGSANGTKVNGERIRSRVLAPGDVIEIGEEAFRVHPVQQAEVTARLVAVAGPLTGQVFPIGDAPLVLGRDVGCDVVVGSARASRRHAEVRRDAVAVVLRDLGSGNGTRVNGERVAIRTLGAGDVVEIGDDAFRVELARPQPAPTTRSPLATSNPNMGPPRAFAPTDLAPPVLPSPAGAPPPGPAVVCPRCQRAVDPRWLDCPWDGASLANGRTVV